MSEFRKRLNECKLDHEIPYELFEILDKYFISIGKSPAEQIRNQPLLSNGKKTDTSIKLLTDGLCATGNCEYYINILHIAHKLWGWENPSIDLSSEIKIIGYYKIISDIKILK